MDPLELYNLTYSPWSEKARWALDHHQIKYTQIEYAPLFGAWGLRWRSKHWRGKLTVPLLLTPSANLHDSLAICEYAEKHGSGTSLLGEDKQAMEVWNQRSETALSAGRSLLTFRVSQDPNAMQDYLPGWIPKPLRGNLGLPIARLGIAFFRRKYGYQKPEPQAWLQTLSQILEQWDQSLAGRLYLANQFSYAEITMAMVLQFVKPVTSETITIPRRSRPCWSTPELAKPFAHLIEWRDEVYRKHR